MAGRRPWLRPIAAFASILFLHLTRFLPLAVNRVFMRALGRIAFHLIPRVRRVGAANLDLAYGDSLTAAEKRRILRGAVDSIATVAAEFSRMPRFSDPAWRDVVHIEGMEHVDTSRGGLFVGGHLGNWEWMGPAVAALGHKVAEVVRPLDDPRLNAAVDRLRRGGGVHTIAKDDAGREVFRLLREGYLLGVLIDQSPRDNAVPTDFFGAPCWSTIAPAMVATRAKAPIYPVSILRGADGRYTIRFCPALELARTGNLREDLVVNTQRCQDALEACIREHPEQWLWLHRRWKVRPRLEEEWRKRSERQRDKS